MLPSSQAVLFLLSADAGVTASDMTIWNEYIDTRTRIIARAALRC